MAGGNYESGLGYFSRASGAEELISLSWALEEENRTFYEHIAREAGEEQAHLERMVSFPDRFRGKG
ncbi:MAG: hypothetical protein WBX50_02890 [Candidatus Deferrimicrobiaceae bacterium]